MSDEADKGFMSEAELNKLGKPSQEQVDSAKGNEDITGKLPTLQEINAYKPKDTGTKPQGKRNF